MYRAASGALAILFFATAASAEDAPAETAATDPAPAGTTETTEKRSDDTPVSDDRFEFSFGDSSLFAPEERAAEIKQIVATESVLFLFEYFLHYRWHLIAAFNLPTAPELSFVDGELVQDFSPPTLSLGGLWTPISWQFDDEENRRLEWQFAALAGMTMKFRKDDPPVFFPLFASRLAILHESDVSIYLGGAFALRLDTAALIYGVGYRF